eukprot:11928944-Karenia_brevis.AAC.1
MCIRDRDWSGGLTTRHVAMRRRLGKAAGKFRRLKLLKKRGGNILGVNRALAVGAAAYGAKVVGMPCYILRRLRALVRAGTTTKARGSSATLDMMLQRPRRLDP